MVEQVAVAAPITDPFFADPEALFSTAEAARLLGLSPRTLQNYRRRWRKTGKNEGPAFVVVGGERELVRYRRQALTDWSHAHEVGQPERKVA